MKFMYLVFLIATIICLGLIDWRFKLAYFYDRKRTIKTLAVAILFFAVWDVIGIRLAIFFIGTTRYLTGVRVGEFPIEELFFLMVLCYSALLAYRFFDMYKQGSES